MPFSCAMRRPVIGAIGVVAALAGIAASSSGALAAGASATSCRTSGLVVWLDTEGNATAGTVFYTMHFTNLSGRTCSVRGYPGVSAVSLGGRQLGNSASRDTGSPVRTITLRNGTSASADLGIVDTGNFSTSMCQPVTAAGLKVFPPGQSAAKTIPFPFSACSRGGVSYLKIRAVT